VSHRGYLFAVAGSEIIREDLLPLVFRCRSGVTTGRCDPILNVERSDAVSLRAVALGEAAAIVLAAVLLLAVATASVAARS
jgi:hypothetical protein